MAAYIQLILTNYKLTVSSTYNCKESSYRYKLNIDDKTTLSNSTSTSTTIYRDGNVGVSAEVWLIQRNGDLSESEPETYGCIHPTNLYQLQVDSNSVIKNYKETSHTLYRDGGVSLTIKVWLRNKHGVLSEVITKTITTSTVNLPPILPTNLSKYLLQSRYTPSGSDRQNIRVRYNLPVEDISINCESVRSREFKMNSSTDYLTHNSYINNLLPYKNYTIQVKVTNNKDLTTEDVLVIETWELEPYDSPVILKNESYNESCIFIQWRSPSQPNGVINRYQHRYYISDKLAPSWKIYTDVQTENSHIACGYKAGDLVTYEIRAGTKVGYGPEATGDESYPACASISHYDLSIQLNEQQIFYGKYAAAETREKVLEDLDPHTNYTIILIAVNNALNQSSAEPRYITTPELAPYNGPSLSIELTESCVYLTIQDPDNPNGIITEYQVGSSFNLIYSVIMFQCSYVFVVQKETSASKRKKRSSVQLPPECDLDLDCYITAEIDSSLVDSDGYDFRVGDGKTYQDYYNAPLEPNQDYKIYQAVTVQMEVSLEIISPEESHCSAPPVVENARMLSSDEDWGVGTTVLYSCEEGFYITGQSEIVCGDDNGVAEWKGKIPICKKQGVSAKVIGLSVGVSSGALILITIAVTVPKVEKSDEYEEVGLSCIQQASTDEPEYVEIPGDKNPAPTYESMNTVTEDHNYEKVVHTVHNISPNPTLYQNMQD
ncbi:PTPRT [Bugula neritina]|uniref:PTPRT n=1 Tax=Bugula neritina TaxID=10212 RepID=A0A7J7KA31_BUGNE|nr:PTPRT [Bugula neritina]